MLTYHSRVVRGDNERAGEGAGDSFLRKFLPLRRQNGGGEHSKVSTNPIVRVKQRGENLDKSL